MVLDYAEVEYNGKKHYMNYSNYCGCFVCSEEGCGLHAHLTSKGQVNQTLAQCYCGWNVRTSVQEEFGLEFEDV